MLVRRHRLERMVHSLIPSRRLILAGGLAVATLTAPAIMAMTAVSTPLAACSGGEESDVFTTTCVPYLVPTSNQGFTSTGANPDIPEIDGIPTTGANSGTILGLEENQAAAGPQPIPRSTFSSSP
jgi:hypothetical protein